MDGMTRREALGCLARIAGGVALSGLLVPAGPAPAAPVGKVLVEGVGETRGYAVSDLVRRVVDAAGGIGRFVSRGDVVILKPNVSWARAPECAATTHPEVLEAMVLLCQEAGAKKVRIADHTIHDAKRCFTVTGAQAVAEKTGAELLYPSSTLMRDMNLHGARLTEWPVFVPFKEADKVINLPVAKVHGSSILTLGMKNWIGAVGGRRHALHQDLHTTIVDLARFFAPTVTLIDATRIMVRNGPSGGNLSDVETRNTLILSDDPVAADAVATRLFGMAPEEIPFITLAEKGGLGARALEVGATKRVTL